MRWVARAGAAQATVVAATVVAALCCGPAVAAGSGTPFHDPNVHGYIALCDLAGDNVSSGSVSSTPFVWKAVSSTPPPAGFAGPGQNTVLTVYQPRRGVDPSEWNGDQVTAASFYRKGSLPTAAATFKDISLSTIVREFPPTWDGLYQLRMGFGRNGYGTSTESYPSTVIQVTGSTWHVIQGGTLPCARAKATSQETFAGIPVTNSKDARPHTPATAPVVQRVSAAESDSAASHVIATSLDGASSSSGSATAGWAVGGGIAAAVVIAAIAGGGLLRRRRRTFVTSFERTH